MSHTLTSPRKSFAPLLLAGTLAFTTPAHAEQHGPGSLGWVRHWNHVAIDASGLDHTPLAPGEARVFGEQLGPGRASRAVAIAQIAFTASKTAICAMATARLARPGPSCSPNTRASPGASGV